MNSKLHICFVTVSTAFGGMEKHTSNLAITLAERGNRVTIAQLNHDAFSSLGTLRRAGISIETIRLSADLNQLSFGECRTILRKWPSATCVFTKGWFPQGSVSFDLAARLTCRRYVTIEHLRAEPIPKSGRSRHFAGLIPGLGIWRYKKLISARLRAVGPYRVVCVSESVRSGLIEFCHFPERKLVTILNGVDTDEFVFNSGHRESIRRRLKISNGTLVFGFVGRISPMKNIEMAIRALRKLVNSEPGANTRFVVVGDGPSANVLRTMVSTLNLQDFVIFVGFSDRPEEYYSAFDVLLLPSLNEGLPLALLEAMASECCTIATAVGGIPEVISNPTLGWLVPSEDESRLVECMRMALHVDRNDLRAMGLRARQRVASTFSANQQFAELAASLEKWGD